MLMTIYHPCILSFSTSILPFPISVLTFFISFRIENSYESAECFLGSARLNMINLLLSLTDEFVLL